MSIFQGMKFRHDSEHRLGGKIYVAGGYGPEVRPSVLQLVGGLVDEFYFPIQLGIIIPIDYHIFQRGGLTTNQYIVTGAQLGTFYL